MYIVFFAIDRVNSAMAFIDNDITKTLLLILCVISTVNSSFLILDERRKRAARERRRAASVARNRAAAPAGSRPAQPRGAHAKRTPERSDTP